MDALTRVKKMMSSFSVWLYSLSVPSDVSQRIPVRNADELVLLIIETFEVNDYIALKHANNSICGICISCIINSDIDTDVIKF